MREFYEIPNGPRKMDRDWLFTVSSQKVGVSSEGSGSQVQNEQKEVTFTEGWHICTLSCQKGVADAIILRGFKEDWASTSIYVQKHSKLRKQVKIVEGWKNTWDWNILLLCSYPSLHIHLWLEPWCKSVWPLSCSSGFPLICGETSWCTEHLLSCSEFKKAQENMFLNFNIVLYSLDVVNS